jgi:hypothetical protein
MDARIWVACPMPIYHNMLVWPDANALIDVIASFTYGNGLDLPLPPNTAKVRMKTMTWVPPSKAADRM